MLNSNPLNAMLANQQATQTAMLNGFRERDNIISELEARNAALLAEREDAEKLAELTDAGLAYMYNQKLVITLDLREAWDIAVKILQARSARLTQDTQ